MPRFPLVDFITNRDNSLSKDSKMVNCFADPVRENDNELVKRFGVSVDTTCSAGTALGMYSWNGHLYAVFGTSLFKDGVSIGTIDGTSNYQFVQNNANTLMVLKNNTKAYTVNTTDIITTISSVNYPAATVPGISYLDGTFYVMDNHGTIYGSGLEDPTTWDPLNYITAEIDPDAGVAIAKQLNYVLAFGALTTEVFYDAANPTGSPLGRVTNSFIPLGCASADSIAVLDGMIIWMTQSKQKGRSIFSMNGLSPEKISTPFVERILDEDTLSGVHASAIKYKGHSFYILTLINSGVTLVFDYTTRVWAQWTNKTLNGSSKSVTSATWASGVVTIVANSHGFSDGDPVVISGATPSGYNGTFNITYVDANTFTYPVATTLISPATGTITATGFTETYFPYINYTFHSNKNLFQHLSNGKIYITSPSVYQDDGVHIDVRSKTAIYDAGNTMRKFFSKIEAVGDKVSSTLYIRHFDDDYTTASVYRPIDLSITRSQIRRNGSARRRAFEVRHTDNVALRLTGLDIDVTVGTA